MSGNNARLISAAIISAAIWVSSSPPALADICDQKKEAAYESKECIRYIFECTVSKEQKFKDLPRESSQRRKYALAANEAARQCKHFSYEEAEAAFSLKLFWLGN